jgi:hypothetical protein
MLPVLVVLFVFSYGLMTLLIVEQGSTIQSQRMLIQQLLGDTHELASMKGKAIREQALSRQAQSQATQKTDPQAPSTRARSNETPSAQAATPKTQPNHSGKLQRPLPPRPPKPASDLVDVRRNLSSI